MELLQTVTTQVLYKDIDEFIRNFGENLSLKSEITGSYIRRHKKEKKPV